MKYDLNMKILICITQQWRSTLPPNPLPLLNEMYQIATGLPAHGTEYSAVYGALWLPIKSAGLFGLLGFFSLKRNFLFFFY